ncbi:MAG: glycosyltransferase family 4 protein [Hyphomicrobium sp.]|nr:glycosyltransferase family 4 protein [Hyphomicrobium sp.]
MTIGYLVPEFPGQTHIMFWREIEALKSMGEKVALVSTRRPSIDCPHDFASAAISETHYIYPPSLPGLLNWAAVGGKGLGQSLSYLRPLQARQTSERAKQAVLIASAIDLTRWARQHGVRHVHGHSCADTAHVLALARRQGGPTYSITLHGDLAVYGLDHQAKLRDASFVCAVGKHLRHQLEKQAGVPPDRVIETFMGIDTARADGARRPRAFVPGKLHIATVARLNAAKGHEYVFQALRQGINNGLDLHYTVVGGGPHEDALKKRTRELDLENHVTFTGSLAEQGVHEVLAAADVLVLASTGLGEAWPVAVMEAMSAGLPVIATVIGATSEMISPGHDGFLVPQADAAAILEKIELLANDGVLRQRLGDAALATARRRFDVKVSAGILRDAIRTAIDRQSTRVFA